MWPTTVACELQCNIPRHQGLGSADERGGTTRLCLWEESDLQRLSIFNVSFRPHVCLKRAAKDCKGRFIGEAVNAINDFFYVNDVLESVRTVIEESKQSEMSAQ